jgi:hypothetical protein
MLVCALHVFWIRRNLFSLLILLVFSSVLAGTKIAYTPSVLPAVLPMLAGIMLCSLKSFHLCRHVIIVILLVVVASFLFMKFLTVTPGNERRANCYHFIFTGVIPLLSPDEGKGFLHGCDAFVKSHLPGTCSNPSLFWNCLNHPGDPSVFCGQGLNGKG